MQFLQVWTRDNDYYGDMVSADRNSVSIQNPDDYRIDIVLWRDIETICTDTQTYATIDAAMRDLDVLTYHVYILEYEQPDPKGNKYYIGMTNNPWRRFREHVKGYLTGKSKWGAIRTRRHGVKKIVYTSEYMSCKEAQQLEGKYWKLANKNDLQITKCASFINPMWVYKYSNCEGRSGINFHKWDISPDNPFRAISPENEPVYDVEAA